MNSYNKTEWKNGQAPALNAENLNKIENGIEEVTNEVINSVQKIQKIQMKGSTTYQNVDTAIENNVVYRVFREGNGNPCGWLWFCGSKNYVDVEVAQIRLDMDGKLYRRKGIANRGTVTWESTWSVFDPDDLINVKMDLVPLDPSSEKIAAMPDGQFYGDTVNHKGTSKGGQSFYDTEYIDTALALKAPLSDFNTLSARAVQPSNVTITQENWQDYSDANNLTPNRTYGISSRIIGPVPPEGETPDPTYGYVDNLPVYNKTAALSFIGVTKTSKVGYQIYYNENECWFRKTDADGVGTWIKLVDGNSLDTALALKAPLSDFNTLSARAVQPSNVTITQENWQDYSDANNLTPNRTYGISSRIIGPVPPEGETPDPTYGYVDNLPVYNKTAALSFIGVTKTSKVGYQIYYNENECWFRKTDADGVGTWIRIVKAPPTTRGLRTYEVVCFGDSLTAGSGCTIPYHYYESLFGNHICHNYGIGGTGYIKERGSSSDPKYDYKGTGQIGKPDSTVELTGGNKVLDHFKENESSITSSSAIVIFAGTNDYGAQYGLDAFETAIRNTYTYVLEHHTQPLIVCTPMNRVARDSDTIPLEEYVNKIIAVCTEMKIPVIDFYHNVQLRPDITAWKTVYFADNIHPNDLGHQLIGVFFGAKLKEYLG